MHIWHMLPKFSVLNAILPCRFDLTFRRFSFVADWDKFYYLMRQMLSAAMRVAQKAQWQVSEWSFLKADVPVALVVCFC